jgi:quercetin dioxygenase-like cupin family protein
MALCSKNIAAVAGVALVAFASVIVAQNPGLTRTIVTKADVSVPNREAVVARVEVAPGGVAGWHTHPGDEISYVTEGEATLMIAGQPPRKVAAGEGFVIPAGVVHNARNGGATAVRLVGVYVVEKGKPLASPAPEPAQ